MIKKVERIIEKHCKKQNKKEMIWSLETNLLTSNVCKVWKLRKFSQKFYQ